ncbi:MAG: hypothetical protein HY905_22190 [Deltaproteobacteria bacterium]|nr:hypothetical protein [Deltaproteobacteria bacterium]
MDRREGADVRRGRRHLRNAATTTVLAALVLAPVACRPEGPADDRAGTSPVTGSGRPLCGSAALGETLPAPSFAGLDPGVLALADAALADPDVVERFAVPEATAERYAVRWVDQSGELAGPAHVCLALPWLDGGGRVVAHEFVLTDLDACRSYADLVAEARRIADDVDTAIGAAGRVDGPVLRERTRRSASHFFTLAVSAWSFQHPIRDGLGGLPFWLLTPERLPVDPPAERLAPVAIYPAGDAGGLVEVVAYDGPAGPFLFSHHAGRSVGPESLGWRFEPAEALRAWRTGVVVRHASEPAGAVRAQAALWTRTLDGGAP